MEILITITFVLCGLWLLIVIPGVIWFTWLHHKGELIGDAPDTNS